jgi:integrase
MINIDVRTKRGSSKEKALTSMERSILFSEFEQKNKLSDKAILILGALGGLRVTEITQTRREWLNIITIGGNTMLEINIPEKDTDLRNKYKDFTTKNKKARTTFIFDEKYIYYLKNFFDFNNLAMSRQAILRRVYNWNKIISREKNKLTVHCLRSSACNYMIYEKDLAPEFVQTCLGHSDIRTTHQHYMTKGKSQQLSYLEGLQK